jgi:class 3 adenylate cyclase
MAILFAAMHPDRVSALALVNSYARYISDNDYPIGFSQDDIDFILQTALSGWGSIDFARNVIPSRADDVEFMQWVAMSMRMSTTPRNAMAQYDYLLRNIDVRRVLPLIQCPVLVLHSVGNRYPSLDAGRYVADHIAGARFVELPGADSGIAGEHMRVVVDELAEFLTGERPGEIDRVLTTVLFTDIVDSTGRAAILGDRRWRMLLDTHDRTIRDELRRFRGREINTTGDGFLAAFDGPARAIRCAQSILASTGSQEIELRIGMHTGECEVRGDDLAGLAVHIAARVGSSARPGEALVSSTVKDLVAGSGIEFEDRGDHELKGVPGTWRLYAVSG